MFASCVACSVHTLRAVSTREGLMCPRCVRFMRRGLEHLDDDAERAVAQMTSAHTASLEHELAA